MNRPPPIWIFLTYSVLAVGLILGTGLDFKRPATFRVIVASGESEVDLRTTQPLERGMELKVRARIRTYDGGAVIAHKGNWVDISQNTNLEITDIQSDLISLFMERGIVVVDESDRTVRVCTRELCADAPAGTLLGVDYVTPGEYVTFSPSEPITVTHRDGSVYHVEPYETLRYYELEDIVERRQLPTFN